LLFSALGAVQREKKPNKDEREKSPIEVGKGIDSP
jgi:hypothetical protein